jgi:hypothetical protein
VPFHGTARELLAERRPVPAPRPSLLDASLAPADEVVAGLLAPEPGDRLPSAVVVSEAVAALRDAWTA